MSILNAICFLSDLCATFDKIHSYKMFLCFLSNHKVKTYTTKIIVDNIFEGLSAF